MNCSALIIKQDRQNPLGEKVSPMKKSSVLACLLGLSAVVFGIGKLGAQIPSQWKAHDMNRARPTIVKPGTQG